MLPFAAGGQLKQAFKVLLHLRGEQFAVERGLVWQVGDGFEKAVRRDAAQARVGLYAGHGMEDVIALFVNAKAEDRRPRDDLPNGLDPLAAGAFNQVTADQDQLYANVRQRGDGFLHVAPGSAKLKTRLAIDPVGQSAPD